MKMGKHSVPQAVPGRGAIIAGVTSLCVSVGGFAIEFLPHTFLIEKYKSIVQMYR